MQTIIPFASVGLEGCADCVPVCLDIGAEVQVGVADTLNSTPISRIEVGLYADVFGMVSADTHIQPCGFDFDPLCLDMDAMGVSVNHLEVMPHGFSFAESHSVIQTGVTADAELSLCMGSMSCFDGAMVPLEGHVQTDATAEVDLVSTGLTVFKYGDWKLENKGCNGRYPIQHGSWRIRAKTCGYLQAISPELIHWSDFAGRSRANSVAEAYQLDWRSVCGVSKPSMTANINVLCWQGIQALAYSRTKVSAEALEIHWVNASDLVGVGLSAEAHTVHWVNACSVANTSMQAWQLDENAAMMISVPAYSSRSYEPVIAVLIVAKVMSCYTRA